jgi:putative hydrolase of the HAD superfamily
MTRPDQPCKVVFWDFHGTLAHAPMEWGAAMVEVLAAVRPGHGIDRETMFGFIQEGFPWHTPERAHPELGIADAWWQHVGGAMARGYGRAGVDGSLAGELAGRVRDQFLKPHRYRVDPAARDALTTVAAAGWTNMVLSNHVPELEQVLADVGLRDLVERVFTSARTGYEKPHREAFAGPLRDAGGPERVWMVGDNPIADVKGAEAAGIPAILVGGRAGDATRTVADLPAAAALIVASERDRDAAGAAILQ